MSSEPYTYEKALAAARRDIAESNSKINQVLEFLAEIPVTEVEVRVASTVRVLWDGGLKDDPATLLLAVALDRLAAAEELA